MPRMDLLSPCVPVGWRVAVFGRLGEDADVDLGGSSGYASLGGSHSIDSVENGHNEILQGYEPPGLFLVITGVLTT